MSDDQGWMAVQAPRHNSLLQHRPQLRIPTPEASLVTPLCLSCAANSLLTSRTGKSGNIRSLARSLARWLCRRCRGRTDGRTDGTDARTGRRVNAPRAHGSQHRGTHCVCVASFAANGRTEGNGRWREEGRVLPWKGSGTSSLLRPSVPPSHDCRRHRGRNCRRQRCRHRRAEQGKGFSLRA